MENSPSATLNEISVKESRINNFNALRLFAAILVIYGHMYTLLGMNDFKFLADPVSSIGVKIFFIISGFLICESWQRDPHIARYAIRRFFRIIPGLALVVFITAFIIGPIFTTENLSNYFMHISLYSYLRNITLINMTYNLPGVFTNNIYPNVTNGSMWSLPLEVLMYITLPVIFFIGRKLKCIKWLLLIASLLFIVLDVFGITFETGSSLIVLGKNMSNLLGAVGVIPYFYVGSFYTYLPKKFLNLQVAFAALLIAVGFSWSNYLCPIIMYIVLPYSILSFAFAKPAVFNKIGSKNDYSYGIYLYGFLVQQMVVAIFGSRLGNINIYFIICSIFAFLFAIISWHLVEKKAQNLSRKIIIYLKRSTHPSVASE